MRNSQPKNFPHSRGLHLTFKFISPLMLKHTFLRGFTWNNYYDKSVCTVIIIKYLCWAIFWTVLFSRTEWHGRPFLCFVSWRRLNHFLKNRKFTILYYQSLSSLQFLLSAVLLLGAVLVSSWYVFTCNYIRMWRKRYLQVCWIFRAVRSGSHSF
jgi:hypothetical protein